MESLFDFNFESRSEEEVKEAFAQLIQFSKKNGNPRCLRTKGYSLNLDGSCSFEKKNIPSYLKTYFNDFEEKGWIKVNGDAIEIRDDLKDFHTPEEVVEIFRETVEEYLKNGGNFYGIYTIRTNFSLGYKFKDHPTYLEFTRIMEKVMDDFAKKLGLKHFIEVPESRGHKMDLFDTKLAKQTVKRIAEDIIPMTVFDDVRDYFNRYAFFRGIDRQMAKPDILVLKPNALEIQSLAEATDIKTVDLILSYCGAVWSKNSLKKYTIIYPDGWNRERVLEELSTPEMIDVFLKEMERLSQLHGGVLT
ncbi:hypothetical protein [Calidifontibacillus erzurumensis]|uniref:hypothetical protein n=1 Tax=Calidifontibacillus erzurumensis TaxID=2741433 RepID=UPI0035B5080D